MAIGASEVFSFAAPDGGNASDDAPHPPPSYAQLEASSQRVFATAGVELLVAHGLLPSQVITGKVAAVSEVWSQNHYSPTEAEVAFLALLASNGHGQIPEQILASKANELTELLSIFFFNPSLPLVAAAAALA